MKGVAALLGRFGEGWSGLRWLLAAALLVVMAGGCASDPSPENAFGFTIPDDIETLDEALEYVRERERDTGALLDDEEVRMSSTGRVIDGPAPDIAVLIIQPSSDEEYRSLQREWAEELQRLFDRWDICELDIFWDLSRTPGADGVPDFVMGIDLFVDSITPGCPGNEGGPPAP